MINFLLFVISFLLVVLFAPLGMVFTLVKSVVLWDFRRISEYYRSLAISLDQFGNVVMKAFFNSTLINRDSIDLFGNPDETISSVLGKNKLKNTLTIFGKCLDGLLNKLDENHSIKSIEN